MKISEKCQDCGREHVLEDLVSEHEEECYRVHVKSLFAGVMYGLLISALFILRL